MLLTALAWLFGALYLQFFPSLPNLKLLSIFFCLSLLPLFILRQSYRYYLFPVFLLSMLYTAWFAKDRLSWSLPTSLEEHPIEITGYIDSLPNKDVLTSTFVFNLESVHDGNEKISVKQKIKLAWRGHHERLLVGDKWQLWVRLKRIHGLQSPGAFDFEAWALQKGLRASGHVLTDKTAKKIGRANVYYFIDYLRQILQEKILANLPKTPTAPWLLALIIGERNGIHPEDWQVLRNTGTNHLMAIAGLHIGIIAGITSAIAMWFSKRSTGLLLRLPAMQVAGIAALVSAIFYSALAGFSIPTTRASLMLSILIAALLLRRKMRAFDVWSLSIIIVLILNPLNVLSESFWLSFGTIALIIYGMDGRLKPGGWWWKWGRVQWVVGLGLVPVTFIFFQQSSLVSFFANSIAIPWLSFLILPFCLLSAVCLFIFPPLGSFLLWLAAKSLSALWWVLVQFSELPFSAWHLAIPNNTILMLTMVGFLLLLLPSGFKGKWLGFFWLLPLFFYEIPKPNKAEVWLTVLDVGQGLSVLIQTKHHTLLYDAGPKLSAQLDMGENIILPYLYQANIKRLDKLIISHGDNDHIGGAFAVMKAIPVTSILSSVPNKISSEKTSACIAGYHWRWDEVNFSFLHPSLNDQDLGNNSSCVLRIDNGSHPILLTGDIEKKAEQQLLERETKQLATSILIVPHHGSKTSSTPAFIQATRPQWVIYTTSYHNRYHFPHPSIVARYQTIHAQQLNTAETGTIQFKLERGKEPSFELYRIRRKRYWY